MSIYLDNSATTRPCDSAVEAMMHAMREDFYNPSALYAAAMGPEKMMKSCREKILRSVHAKGGSRVVFLSGGTEADNLAILGQQKKCRGQKVFYSAGEHPAVKEACQAMEEAEAVAIPYTREGLVDVQALEQMLDERTALICIMQVNNETGTIQPLQEIGQLIRRLCPKAHFHVDGVQGYLRVPFDMQAVGADSYALSGHKIHGPKGIGALVMGPGVQLHPRQVGGGQENTIRSGTENTVGIAGLSAAIDAFPKEHTMQQVKMHLYEGLKEIIPGLSVNGPAPDAAYAAPHILNVSLPPVRSETMLHALEGKKIYVGIGSACSSHKQKVSPVLRAMHVDQAAAESALRFSFCPENTIEEMNAVLEAVKGQYALLSRFQRR
ncbi:MAG: cysteine desulfurase [Clostridia bacterium]|nr:cysteine desulfurase [Clostridia bacterium]